MRLRLINGPNLNLLGIREPDVYGSSSLSSIESKLIDFAKKNGANLDCFQTNSEGDLVEEIHNSINQVDGIIINAGAYTHTSVALRDALLGAGIPFVEVHMSNVYSREKFRHNSFIAEIAVGVICGFGFDSYKLAIKGMLNHLREVSREDE
tara:strand:- start:1809 stop:2261 length:453 start_codon:yes stop_codon:yes gene_type:complete